MSKVKAFADLCKSVGIPVVLQDNVAICKVKSDLTISVRHQTAHWIISVNGRLRAVTPGHCSSEAVFYDMSEFVKELLP